MTVVPHAGSRRTVLHRSVPAQRASRTGVMSSSAFAIGALAVLSIGLLSLLVLNTALAKGSFRAHELRIQKAELAQREQLLRTQIQDASSAVTLTKRAKELGLVPATSAPVVGGTDAPATDPAAAGQPTAPATPEPAQSAPAPGVATTPGTDTEQPLGITGQ